MSVNRISESEQERLGLFTEEMGEAQQVLGKILRHGLDSRNPLLVAAPDNNALLEEEAGDVLAALDLLTAAGTLNLERVQQARLRKLEKLKRWLHCSDNLAAVQELLGRDGR